MEPLSAKNTVAGVRSIGLVKKTGDRASGKQKQSYTKGFEEITSTMPGAPKRRNKP